jgi:hypothetical protein
MYVIVIVGGLHQPDSINVMWFFVLLHAKIKFQQLTFASHHFINIFAVVEATLILERIVSHSICFAEMHRQKPDVRRVIN